MKKKKILYVITQGEWGGAQRYVFDLAIGLRNEFDIYIAIGEPSGRQDLQNKILRYSSAAGGIPPHGGGDIKIFSLKHLRRKISPVHDVLAIFELKKLYKELEPDIIHLNSSKAGIIGSLSKLSPFTFHLSPYIVYTIHGWVFNEPLTWWRKKIYFYLEKWTAGVKNKFIVLSDKESEQGRRELGIPQNKLVVVPHGVSLPQNPLSKLEARREFIKKTSLPIKNDAIWIGSIANYYETKGLDVLITAIAQIKNIPQNFVCLLIGEGSERSKLKKLISNYKLENKIYLVGSANDADRFLPAFDLFVLPSRKEGLPYSLLEAKANGVPIVATDVGGVSTLVDKKTGLLVLPNDPIALSRAISSALSNPIVPEESTTFTLEEELNRTTSLYRSLLEQQT